MPANCPAAGAFPLGQRVRLAEHPGPQANHLPRMRANPAGIWLTWRRAAFVPPLTPPSVE